MRTSQAICALNILSGLARLPKTPNNKTDRQALSQFTVTPEQDSSHLAQLQEYPPEIVTLWQKKLQKQDINPHASFFDQGGNSIQFIDLLSSVTHQTGKSLEIKVLLENPSLQNMQAMLSEQQQTTNQIILHAPVEQHPAWRHEALLIPSLPNRQFFLSFGGQHNLWVVNHSIVLNNANEQLSFDVIKKAMLLLIAHHPALRTGFTLNDYQEYITDLKTIQKQDICFDLSSLTRCDDIATFIDQEISSIRLNSALVRLFYVKKAERVFLTPVSTPCGI